MTDEQYEDFRNSLDTFDSTPKSSVVVWVLAALSVIGFEILLALVFFNVFFREW